MPEYRQPPCNRIPKNKVGGGGNGQVYIAYNPNFVCKIFSVNRDIPHETRERRYKRFCQEISTQKDLAKRIKGVLPVEDFCMPEELSDAQPAWFTMPKANGFDVCNQKSLEDKISDLIELGNIIKNLHSLNMAHRDIKPENILVYNNCIHLSDYGLIWIEGVSNLTNMPEKIGPIKILPPELESCEDINGCEYEKSDAYLFAKVVWMYIKKDKNGFKGPYSRSASQIYLRQSEYDALSLEPLHLMMINATKDDWNERIGITECLKYLDLQLRFINDDVSREEQWKYALQERFLHFEANVGPDYKTFNQAEKIKELLKSLIPGAIFELDDGLEKQRFQPTKCRPLSGDVFEFVDMQHEGEFSRTLIKIEAVDVGEERISLRTLPFDAEELEQFRQDRYNVFNAKSLVIIEREILC